MHSLQQRRKQQSDSERKRWLTFSKSFCGKLLFATAALWLATIHRIISSNQIARQASLEALDVPSAIDTFYLAENRTVGHENSNMLVQGPPYDQHATRDKGMPPSKLPHWMEG